MNQKFKELLEEQHNISKYDPERIKQINNIASICEKILETTSPERNKQYIDYLIEKYRTNFKDFMNCLEKINYPVVYHAFFSGTVGEYYNEEVNRTFSNFKEYLTRSKKTFLYPEYFSKYEGVELTQEDIDSGTFNFIDNEDETMFRKFKIEVKDNEIHMDIYMHHITYEELWG